MLEWEDIDRYSFKDSDRFEEVSSIKIVKSMSQEPFAFNFAVFFCDLIFSANAGFSILFVL